MFVDGRLQKDAAAKASTPWPYGRWPSDPGTVPGPGPGAGIDISGRLLGDEEDHYTGPVATNWATPVPPHPSHVGGTTYRPPVTDTVATNWAAPVGTRAVWPTGIPQSYGRDVNIINIVREHGPRLIAQILKELAGLDEKQQRLQEERSTLERLVDAVK
jgi:hypothetical protein